jgi:DnaJ-class molecular chaperone
MHFVRFLFLTLFIGLFSTCWSQSKQDSLLNVYFDKGKEQISLGNYDAGQEYFKKIFALKTTLPDELAYYYGLTLVKQKNYKKGKEAIEKYLSLTGSSGKFFKESQVLLKEIDLYVCRKCNNTGKAEVNDTCATCAGSGKITVDCNTCNVKGIEFCTACGGNGVFVSKGNLSSSYSTCTKCHGNGYLKCHICEGTHKKQIDCVECKGVGYKKKKVTCPH